MVDQATLSYRDYTDEKSRTTINVEDVTAANFDQLSTDLNLLRTTQDAIIIGASEKATFAIPIFDQGQAIVNNFQQRETKWQVIAARAGSQERVAINEIPQADLALLENGSPYLVRDGVPAVVTAATAVQAWLDAFNAIARDPAGNLWVVTDVYHVGRNV